MKTKPAEKQEGNNMSNHRDEVQKEIQQSGIIDYVETHYSSYDSLLIIDTAPPFTKPSLLTISVKDPKVWSNMTSQWEMCQSSQMLDWKPEWIVHHTAELIIIVKPTGKTTKWATSHAGVTWDIDTLDNGEQQISMESLEASLDAWIKHLSEHLCPTRKQIEYLRELRQRQEVNQEAKRLIDQRCHRLTKIAKAEANKTLVA